MMEGYYYNIEEDLKKCPDAFCMVIFGGRNTGKTYSTLKSAKINNIPFAYIKRTKEDVKLLCAGNSTSKKQNATMDLSPFKSLNRDMKWNVRAFQVFDGLGAFYNCDDDNQPVGNPIGYLLALSMVSKYKGFDMSDVDWLIFDEFVPKIYDRVLRSEGESVLDLYKTVGRDREHRGKDALKLICLANADNAASPLTNTLEITDDIVKMSIQKEAEFYNQEREIYIHRLIDNKSFREKEAESKIYKAMAGTAWAKTSLDNDFGFNDFSNVQRINLKHCKPYISFSYKNKTYYVYVNDDTGLFQITQKQFNKKVEHYNLTLENDQKSFYDVVWILKNACTEGRCIFEDYSLYDLVINYNKFFKL